METDIKVGASYPQSAQVIYPRCQYCGDDPAKFMPTFAQIGTGQVTVWMCANDKCRAIYSIQLTGVQAPQNPSNIIRP